MKRHFSKGGNMMIHDIVETQRAYYLSGATRSYEFRRQQLRKLLETLSEHIGDMEAALYQDLHKSAHESYMSEISLILEELRYHLKHLRRWMRPERVFPSLGQMPSSVKVYREPRGVVLIMSPWNYPLLLTLSPLIGALSAGNCAVVKPSAYSPASSALIKDLLERVFPPEYVHIVQGGREENTALLKERFDHIFFTGSTAVGKVVMRSASEYLTPVTLELGGKSPAIIDASADIASAARKIVFGKIINAGQTCIAPDHLYVDRRVADKLIAAIRKELETALGSDPLSYEDYPSIINRKQFDRLQSLLSDQKIIHGGRCEFPSIEPTLLYPSPDAPVMETEIFGPILPVITFDTIQEVIDTLKNQEKPLALYLFTQDAAVKKRVITSLSYGGGCINDTVIHIASNRTPFGGVGMSGMGSYHGRRSFLTFSHEKTIVDKWALFDLPVRYHPYTEGKKKLLRRLL